MAKRSEKGPNLTERERQIINAVANVSVARAHKFSVGIIRERRSCKKEFIRAFLLLVGDENSVHEFFFRPRYEDFKGKVASETAQVKRCYNACVKYLAPFLGRDFLINLNDDKRYFPESNMGSLHLSERYEPTVGLYLLGGAKIPEVIGKGFELEKICEQAKGLSLEYFDFDFFRPKPLEFSGNLNEYPLLKFNSDDWELVEKHEQCVGDGD